MDKNPEKKPEGCSRPNVKDNNGQTTNGEKRSTKIVPEPNPEEDDAGAPGGPGGPGGPTAPCLP